MKWLMGVLLVIFGVCGFQYVTNNQSNESFFASVEMYDVYKKGQCFYVLSFFHLMQRRCDKTEDFSMSEIWCFS